MPKTRPEQKNTDGASTKRPAPTKNTGRRFSNEELSRHEREVRGTRVIFTGMGALAILVVAILAYGWWHEYVAASSEPVASVGGQSITIESYADQVDYQRKAREQQLYTMQAQLAQAGPGSGMESLADMLKQQIQQIQSSLVVLPDQTLEQMIDEQMIRKEATTRGITVSALEIDAEIVNNFGDQPTPVPAPTTDPAAPTPQAPDAAATSAPAEAPSAAQTPDSGAAATPEPTPAAAASPVPTADVQANVSNWLTQYGVNQDKLRSMIETQLLYQKLQTAMGADVPTSAEQVHARHILVDGQDKAKEIEDKLKAGSSFEDLAKAESTDTGSKDKGGDLGWFARGTMIAEFDDAAFKLDVNQISDPIQTTYGWHIIQVLEKDPNRPLEPQALEQAKTAVISKWMDNAGKGPEVKRYLTESQKTWVYKRIKWTPPQS